MTKWYIKLEHPTNGKYFTSSPSEQITGNCVGRCLLTNFDDGCSISLGGKTQPKKTYTMGQIDQGGSNRIRMSFTLTSDEDNSADRYAEDFVQIRNNWNSVGKTKITKVYETTITTYDGQTIDYRQWKGLIEQCDISWVENDSLNYSVSISIEKSEPDVIG